MSFTLPPVTITAVVTGGALVATFDGVPYERRLNSLVVNCDTAGPVVAYRGLISDAALIATHPIGNRNTYMPVNRDVVPAGFPLFVKWPNASSGVATATAVFEGEM